MSGEIDGPLEDDLHKAIRRETRLSLLAQMRQDDPQAWEDAIDLYRPMVHGWLEQLLFQTADVEDLTQDVMLTVSREISAFEHLGRVGSFRNWLKTITVNRAREFHRYGKIRPKPRGGSEFMMKVSDVAAPHASSGIASLEFQGQLITRILDVVHKEFSQQSAELFCKHVLQRIPAATIAEEYGVTTYVVYQTKSRIMRRLREVFRI